MRTGIFATRLVAALFALGIGAAAAQTLPHQKLGLWRADAAVMGRHFVTQTCVDAAYEAKASVFAAGVRKNAKCESRAVTHNADGSWTSISKCEFLPGVMRTSRSDISGDFNSRVTITFRSPPEAPPRTTMVMTWTGPCKPGQRGGDTIMPDGKTINVLDGH